MTRLCGRGIWLEHGSDLQRAAEMATEIDGNYIIAKVGHGPYYYPEAARELLQRAGALGLSALGWVHLTPRLPLEARKSIVSALSLGYEAVVLFIGPEFGVGDSLDELAQALLDVEAPLDRLLLASPPPAYLGGSSAIAALVPACQGGWMPLCFAAWDPDAAKVVDRMVYQALDELSLLWNKAPDIYPVLSPTYGLSGDDLLPERFIPWIEAIIRHGVDFFSVYRAAEVEKVIWPMLQAISLPCMETGGRAPVESGAAVGGPGLLGAIPQPVYITATASDTVMGIISRHGLNRTIFWEWNAHLWESRGLPRDPDYLQEGWRIRVK